MPKKKYLLDTNKFFYRSKKVVYQDRLRVYKLHKEHHCGKREDILQWYKNTKNGTKDTPMMVFIICYSILRIQCSHFRGRKNTP